MWDTELLPVLLCTLNALEYMALLLDRNANDIESVRGVVLQVKSTLETASAVLQFGAV